MVPGSLFPQMGTATLIQPWGDGGVGGGGGCCMVAELAQRPLLLR